MNKNWVVTDYRKEKLYLCNDLIFFRKKDLKCNFRQQVLSILKFNCTSLRSPLLNKTRNSPHANPAHTPFAFLIHSIQRNAPPPRSSQIKGT